MSAQRVQERSSRSRVRITLQELFSIWLGGRVTPPREICILLLLSFLPFPLIAIILIILFSFSSFLGNCGLFLICFCVVSVAFFPLLLFFFEIRCNIFIPLFVYILADLKNPDITISFEKGIWNNFGNYMGIFLRASSENLLADIVVQGRKTSGRKRLLTIPVAETIDGEIQRTAERHIHSFYGLH